MSVAPRIVVDTNVLVAGLRSRRGASFRLLSLVDKGLFEINLSVPLVLEYEEVAKRDEITRLSGADIDAILDYLCRVGRHWRIYFLWRPFLPDPKDDMVLELAVAANCQYIVTFNEAHFVGCGQFGIEVIGPKSLLMHLGALP